MGMDSKQTVKDLKDLVQRFCEERDWDQFHGPKDLAIGVVTKGKKRRCDEPIKARHMVCV
jgi:hypothetical protein